MSRTRGSTRRRTSACRSRRSARSQSRCPTSACSKLVALRAAQLRLPSRNAPRPRIAVHVMPSTRRVYDAHQRAVRRVRQISDRDRHRPERHAVQVVDGAVERIDHPLQSPVLDAREEPSSASSPSPGHSSSSRADDQLLGARSIAVTTSVGEDLVAATRTPAPSGGQQRARPRWPAASAIACRPPGHGSLRARRSLLEQ